jgi:hypothetical protein
LLQLIRAARDSQGFNTSIVVSAWDLAKSEALRPRQWIEKRIPLLWQYLEANRTKYPYDVFGVSAQGANLSASKSLLEKVRPSDRIEVAHENRNSHDITIPLRWVLE